MSLNSSAYLIATFDMNPNAGMIPVHTSMTIIICGSTNRHANVSDFKLLSKACSVTVTCTLMKMHCNYASVIEVCGTSLVCSLLHLFTP